MKQYYFLGFFTFLFPVLLAATDVKKDYPMTDFMRVTKPEGRNLLVGASLRHVFCNTLANVEKIEYNLPVLCTAV